MKWELCHLSVTETIEHGVILIYSLREKKEKESSHLLEYIKESIIKKC